MWHWPPSSPDRSVGRTHPGEADVTRAPAAISPAEGFHRQDLTRAAKALSRFPQERCDSRCVGARGIGRCRLRCTESVEVCLDDTLVAAAIGAAVGAGAGVIVDAALTQDHGVRLSVEIRF